MLILKVIALSTGSIVVLFILTKIMGQREMSQLSIFDYIISITIGSIAAEMATSLENNFVEPLVAMIVYAVVTLIIGILNTRFVKLRPIFSGRTLILYDNGTLFKENFKKSKIDLNEFLVQCRTNGYFNLSDIKTALLEENGKISFLPMSEKRPANPSDFNIHPVDDNIVTNIILDGKIMEKNLSELGYDKLWLMNTLQKQGITKIDNIFLATYNSTDQSLSAYLTNKNLWYHLQKSDGPPSFFTSNVDGPAFFCSQLGQSCSFFLLLQARALYFLLFQGPFKKLSLKFQKQLVYFM